MTPKMIEAAAIAARDAVPELTQEQARRVTAAVCRAVGLSVPHSHAPELGRINAPGEIAWKSGRTGT